MPEDNELDTSSEVSTETQDTPAPDTGSEDFQQPETQDAKPETPADWRVEKYGADWQNSLDYQRDTVKYLRGELDKAKGSRSGALRKRTAEANPRPRDARPETSTPADTATYRPLTSLAIGSSAGSICTCRERAAINLRMSMQKPGRRS